MWSVHTDHNPLEVKMAKGWVYKEKHRPPHRRRKPHWAKLRGTGVEPAQARESLSKAMDQATKTHTMTSWQEIAQVGLETALTTLGPEPERDPRPWQGKEAQLLELDLAVARAFARKREAQDDQTRWEASCGVRRAKRQRAAWLRRSEGQWWEDQAAKVQAAADHGNSFEVFFGF